MVALFVSIHCVEVIDPAAVAATRPLDLDKVPERTPAAFVVDARLVSFPAAAEVLNCRSVVCADAVSHSASHVRVIPIAAAV